MKSPARDGDNAEGLTTCSAAGGGSATCSPVAGVALVNMLARLRLGSDNAGQAGP